LPSARKAATGCSASAKGAAASADGVVGRP
jgi:hypothetical protein